MLLNHLIVALVAVISCQVEGSKILGIFWTPSRSHHMAGSPLLQELAKRGHEVHLLSSFLDKNVDIPTYKQELLTGIVGAFDNFINPNFTFIDSVTELISINTRLVDRFWQNAPIKNLMKSRPKYDVVIILAFFNDYVVSLGEILDSPVVAFSAMSTNVVNNIFVANPNLPYESNRFLQKSMGSFFGRLGSVTFNSFYHLMTKYIIHPIQVKGSRKYLPNMRTIEELHKTVSLVLVNSHFTLEAPRPHVPNMILIGGYQMQDVKKLPEKLGNFLDSATDGAILFSMGTNVKIAENFNKEQLDVVMKGLAKLAPLKIVFKSEIEIPTPSDNILVLKWLPQNDILAHPNIKLFISHCGRGGMTEAVIHGVPILGIPFFADQDDNVNFAEESGFAVKLTLDDLNQANFDNALKEVLNNPKYAANIKKRSAVLRKQPVKPMDNAIWWIEHIIEHKGGEHLRNAGMDLEWYQLYMVDIMAFYLIVASITISVFFLVCKWIFKKLCRLLGVCESDKKKLTNKKTN